MIRFPIIGLLSCVWALAFFSPLRAQTIEAPASAELVKLSGNWKFQPGDDLDWARPDFDDSQWRTVPVPGSWRDNGYSNVTGFAWYRLEIRLKGFNRGEAEKRDWTVALKVVTVGSFEVYAGGRRIGGTGRLSPKVQIVYTPMLVFTVPPEALDNQGRLVLAVRCGQDARLAKFGRDPCGILGDVWLGNREFVAPLAEAENQGLLFAHLPLIFCAVFLVLSGLYHLHLYFRRRTFTEYLWFGLMCMAFAVSSLGGSRLFAEYSGWSLGPLLVIARGYQVMLVFWIQFLWPFLGRRINPALRAAQAFYLVLFVLRLTAPLHWAETLMPLSLLVDVPVVVGTIFVTSRAAWKGDPDARVIGIGFFLMAVIVLLFLGQLFRLFEFAFFIRPVYGGVFALIAMAVSLSNRFDRAHTELETLNRDLEHKVEERTVELNEKNVELSENLKRLDEAKREVERRNLELKEKNEELVASHQQADRIFSALAEALPGTVLDGKYRLDEKIGAGGFGAVFRGTHLALNRAIAVKVFRPSPGNDSAEAVERFRLEGVSASRLSHPNIVAVLDSGVSREGVAYLVMELLEGRPLTAELHRSGKLTVERAARILVPVCKALAEAHRQGVIHRDVKPENVFLNRTPEGGEVVKVVDFGIAKMVGEDTDETLQKLTATGSIIGTPTYMAPERLNGDECDAKSDVYSVGVMLYEMLCGRPPFQPGALGLMNLCMKHLHEAPPPPREFAPGLSPDIEALVMRTLAKRPADRPTAGELAAEFVALCGGFNATTVAIDAHVETTEGETAATLIASRPDTADRTAQQTLFAETVVRSGDPTDAATDTAQTKTL